jgi:glycosyltransferase involved in cell wall biosynthesis
LRGGIRQEGQNLTVLTPAPLLPFRYNRFINGINSWIRRRSIRRALRKLGLHTPVLWVYAPDAPGIVGTLGEVYSLYYCADDWSASYQWWNNSGEIRAREMELAGRVDLVVGTSTKIVDRWQNTHQNVKLVTNGADVESFLAARNPELAVPEDLRAIPSPRIGYVGYVDARFDTALYAQLAGAHPDWNFVIVGPLMEKYVDLTKLRRMPNVHFLGPRTRAQLPAYMKGFDVCTIPYICSKLAESIFPLKLFEYLAAGRSVVATGLPELAPYADYVRIAHSAAAFESSLALSLTAPFPPPSEHFVHENSWASKAGLLWNTMCCALGNDDAARAGCESHEAEQPERINAGASL